MEGNPTGEAKKLRLVPAAAWYAPGPGPEREHIVAFLSMHIQDRRPRITRFRFQESSTSWQDGVHFFADNHIPLSQQVAKFIGTTTVPQNIKLEHVRELLEKTSISEVDNYLREIFLSESQSWP